MISAALPNLRIPSCQTSNKLKADDNVLREERAISLESLSDMLDESSKATRI